jgi:hypothetical protein
MFEYLGTLIGMYQVDGIISSAQAEATSQKSQVVQTAPPRPAYRVPRDQRFEAIRKRFDRQLEADKNTSDPHADMWDKDWINKKD